MKKGDLCHIPQGTILLNETTTKYLKPDKPLTGVYIDDAPLASCRLHVAGQNWFVKKKDVYPIKETEDGKTGANHTIAI